MAITKYSPDSGLYLVAESIDCGGKGTIISTIKKDALSKGKTIIDTRLLWPSEELGRPADSDNPLIRLYGTADVIPDYAKLKEFYAGKGKTLDAIFTCEPTWAHIGLAIRKKITHEVAGKNYSAGDTAQAYADDRQELISKLIRPAIEDGVDVFCERNFCSSVVYQSSMDNPVSPDHILNLEGNRFAIEAAPHLYVICDVGAETAMERKEARKEKQDHCKFEVPEFQRRIEDKYRSVWLKELLNSHGSIVAYVNTEKPTTPEATSRAALDIVRMFKEGNLADGERRNY